MDYVKKFEEKFAKYIGVKYAMTTSGGTGALHIALAALGIGPGDEVIIPKLHILLAQMSLCSLELSLFSSMF